MERFAEAPGNTPLTRVPADYSAGAPRRWFIVERGPDAGKKMFFFDTRPGGGEGPTVLFVHGNPECSYTYRMVIKALAGPANPGGARIVAMDHIGFGLSDQASHEMVDKHHAGNLAQLVEALDLRDVTLVVHDWGGPIGIGALLLDSPERVANLVVLNSTVFPIPPDGLTFENFPVPVLFPWARTAKTTPDRIWGIHSAIAVTFAPAGRIGLMATYMRLMITQLLGIRRDTRGDAFNVFRDQFATRANARSSKRMVRQTPVWGHGYSYEDAGGEKQDNHDFYREIQQRIGPAWGPSGQAIGVAAVIGSFDPLAKESVLDQWRDALPQIDRDLRVIEGETHFIEERRPEEIAEAIVRLNTERA